MCLYYLDYIYCRIAHYCAASALEHWRITDGLRQSLRQQAIVASFSSAGNCAENLPLYAGVVLLLEVRGVANGAIDSLAVAYISFRIFHSLIHLFNLNPNFRVVCLGIQFICLLGLMTYGIM